MVNLYVKYYNLYDSVNIKYVNTKNRFFQKMDLFNKDYEYFLADKIESNPDITINISNFSRRENGYLVENDEFLIDDDYIFGNKKYKLAIFQYSIEINNSKFNINVNPNLFAGRVMHHLLLDYLINLTLFHKGFSNLHCSGIERNHESILISGPGGSGKSSFALYCLNKGYRLLGDDRIFLKNGEAYPFPECPGVNFDNYKYVKNILNLNAKLNIMLNKVINIVFLNYIGMLISMKFFDVFPLRIVGKKSRVKSILFLQPSYKFSVKSIKRDEIINKLNINQFYEDKYMHKLIFNYSTIFPKNIFINYVNSYSKQLSYNLPEDITGYIITFQKDEYNSVNRWLDDHL